MEGKKSFFIILIIVAILTIVVLGLTGFILVTQTSGSAQKEHLIAISEEDKRPKDEDLLRKKIFESEQFFNLKLLNDGKHSIIALNVELEYYKKVDGIKDIETKITNYQAAITELIATYFQKMTIDDAMKIETKDKSKKDLKEEINKLLSSSEDEYKDIIYEITFEKWFCQ